MVCRTAWQSSLAALADRACLKVVGEFVVSNFDLDDAIVHVQDESLRNLRILQHGGTAVDTPIRQRDLLRV